MYSRAPTQGKAVARRALRTNLNVLHKYEYSVKSTEFSGFCGFLFIINSFLFDLLTTVIIIVVIMRN